MSARDEIAACALRESTALLAASDAPRGVANREAILDLMRQAYLAGFDLGLEAWGESLDRMQGALAEAHE